MLRATYTAQTLIRGLRKTRLFPAAVEVKSTGKGLRAWGVNLCRYVTAT